MDPTVRPHGLSTGATATISSPKQNRTCEPVVTNKFKQATLTALRMALRPLVRILLRNGVTYKEAAEICKQTFVEVARDDYGVHRRPTNVSRIAILTGLSRHEVKKVKDALAADPEELERMNTATRVLGGWHTDPDFLDATGSPRVLQAAGDSNVANSFAGLCHRYAPDIPVTAMLKELQRVNSVALHDDGTVEVVSRYFMPASQDPDAVLRAGSVVEDLGDTVVFNLSQDREAGEVTRFEGRATNQQVRATDSAAFRTWLENEAQTFLERADNWLAQHERRSDGKRSERIVRLGVGVYQISSDKEN